MALGLSLRLFGLGEESFWFDEAYTWTTSTQLSLPDATAFDPFYPPLYPTIMWYWYAIGDTEAWGRLLSVIFSMAVLPVVYLIGRQIASNRLGLIAAGLLAINPIQVQYAQEARAYGLLNLLVALTLWAIICLTISRRHHLAAAVTYVVSMGLILLLSNISPVILGVANLAVLLVVVRRRDLRLALTWTGLQVLAVLPWVLIWLPSFVKQWDNMTDAYWMPHVTPVYLWNVIARDMFAAHLPYYAFGLVLIVVAGLTLYGLVVVRQFPRGKDTSLILAVFIFAGPIATALISWAVNDVLATRQQSWVTISIALVLAAVVSRGLEHSHPFDRVAYSLLGGMLALIMLTGTSVYLLSQNKEDWRDVAEVVDLKPRDVVVYTAAHTEMPFAYYADLPPVVQTIGADRGRHKIDTWAWRVLDNGAAEVRMPYVAERKAGESSTSRLDEAINAVGARRVWVIDSEWDTDAALAKDTKEFLDKYGDVGETYTWKGNPWASPGVSPVTVRLYEIKDNQNESE